MTNYTGTLFVNLEADSHDEAVQQMKELFGEIIGFEPESFHMEVERNEPMPKPIMVFEPKGE